MPDEEHGRVIVLRDTRGVTDAHAVIVPALMPIVARFTGKRTCAEIAVEAGREMGADIPVAVVVRLAKELERGLFLEGHVFRAALARVEAEFSATSTRKATHAGGAYHAERGALERYIDDSCLATAMRDAGSAPLVSDRAGAMRALIAPHIDPWRGALGYGRAYSALAEALPPEADTFVVFGTSHAPMAEPFALCRKAFATPLGTVKADVASIDMLAARAEFDPYADQMNHKREHSIEFQVVLLKHIMKAREFRIVPVLAGLGAEQSTGADPSGSAQVVRFLAGVRDLVESRPGRVVIVAGADMAHVGPRFGDARAFGKEERAALESLDRASLDRAAAVD
ncbi:MAG: AmmeMemoRadiSam system protein B, partial [Polyangiaceae bacterium]